MIDLLVNLMPLGKAIMQPVDMLLSLLGKLFSMMFR